MSEGKNTLTKRFHMSESNNKRIIAIGIVVIVAIAAIAFFAMSNGSNDNKEEKDVYSLYLTENSGKTTVSSIDTKLLVFGNANNDVYLDEDDVKFIQDIVDGKTKWDKSANPLADTNADGKITSDDVSLLKRFINGDESSMFYLNSYLDVKKVKWPMTGKIAIQGNPEVEMLKIMGMTDRIVYNNPSYPYDYETIVASGATITLSQGVYSYDETFLNAVEAGYSSFPLDVIQLFEGRLMNGIEGMATTVTVGALFNAYGHGIYDDYLKYAENVQKIISSATANIPDDKHLSYVFITSHSSTAPGNIGIDTHCSAVENFADIAVADFLKLDPSYPVTENGYITGLSIENVLKYDPDVIFIEYTEGGDYDAYQKRVAEMAGWFQSAGFTGQLIGVNYGVVGSASAASTVPLLVSYVYGNDSYDEEDGWEQLVYYYNTFLDGNYTVESAKKSVISAYIIQ